MFYIICVLAFLVSVVISYYCFKPARDISHKTKECFLIRYRWGTNEFSFIVCSYYIKDDLLFFNDLWGRESVVPLDKVIYIKRTNCSL